MRTAFSVLALVLVLGVGALIVVPSFIDWSERRDLVEDAVERLTGWRLHTQGDIRLRLLPEPQLALSRVRVIEGPLHGDTVSGQIGAVRVTVSLRSLLTGTLDIDRLTLSRPDLHWRRSAPAQDGDTRRSTDDDPTPWLAPRSIAALTVEGGRFLMTGSDVGVVSVRDLSVSGEIRGFPGPFDLQSSGRWFGVEANVALRGGPPSTSGAVPVNLVLELSGAAGTLRLAGLAIPDERLTGEVGLTTTDLGATLQAVAGIPVAEGAAARNLIAGGALEVDADGLRLSGLEVSSGPVDGSGSLMLGWRDGIDADLDLTLSELDLGTAVDPTLRLAAAFLGGTDAEMPALPVDLPDTLQAEVDLTVAAARLGDGLLRDLRLQGLLRDRAVTLYRLSAEASGQTDLAVSGSIGLEEGGPRVDLLARLESRDARGLLSELGIDLPGVPADRLRRVVASGRLDGRPGDFRATGVEIRADGAQLNMGLAYRNRGGPGLGLRLDLDRLDLDRYLPDLAAQTTLPLVDAVRFGRSLAGRINLNVNCTIGSVVLGGRAWQDLRLDATLTGDTLVLRDARLGAVDGASIAVRGHVADLVDLRGLDLGITAASTPGLARLLDLVGLTVPPVVDRAGDVAVEATVAGASDALSVSAVVDAELGRLEFTGTVSPPADDDTGAVAASGVARLRHTSLAVLAESVLGLDGAVHDLGPVDVFGEVALDPDGWSVTGARAALGPASVIGELRFDRRTDHLAGSLQVGAVRMRDLLGQANRWPLDRLGGWSDTPLAPEGLAPGSFALDLSGSALIWDEIAIVNPSLRISGDDTRLTLEEMSGEVFGGRLGAHAAVVFGDPANLELQLNLVGIAFASFAEALFRAGGVEGTAGVRLSVTGTGRSPAELVRSLTGDGLIAIAQGRIADFDLAALDDALTGPTTPVGFIDLMRSASRSGQTAFASLNAPFSVQEGVATADAIRLIAGRGMGQGAGLFDLLGWELSADLDFSLYDHPDAPAFGLTISGPPRAPQRRLRGEALQAYVAGRVAEGLTEQFGPAPDASSGDAPPPD